ncbi:GyrI-like domain-containing protein, partial [Enterococcus faecium]|uniref:GyrI-like domain-containing protein n=1 Tax=Enterococcus faecium TaxID=1352 RepID=UPI0035683595
IIGNPSLNHRYRKGFYSLFKTLQQNQLKGKVPECIQEGWKYAMEVFFPEEGYRHSGKPDLEVYFEGDMKKENYSMELWIPVEKEN